jgi:glycosyltransferase involved in cell wall biosynthesis
MLLSICIPTYNRLECLINCLNSISISGKNFINSFEVCVSDNNSYENVQNIIDKFKDKINIKFLKNDNNLGHGRNFLKAVSIANGKYVWTLGNDDLLVPHAIEKILNLLKINTHIDFFFINSYNLHSKYIFSFPQPFNTVNLPKKMDKYSSYNKNKQMNFFDLIDPKISFDFLMGMYLLVFKKEIWDKNLDQINYKKIEDPNIFSNFDNTCGYVKIISKGFSKSKVFFQAEPLSVNLYGEREWEKMYNFIEIVRIPEVLDVHRSNGLSFFKFHYCKNYSLKNFFPNFLKMMLDKEQSGIKYINFKRNFLYNLFYPNCYLSIIYFLIRKIKKFIL